MTPSVNRNNWIVYLRITIDLMTSLEQKGPNNVTLFLVYVSLAPSKVTHIHVPHTNKPYKFSSGFLSGGPDSITDAVFLLISVFLCSKRD